MRFWKLYKNNESVKEQEIQENSDDDNSENSSETGDQDNQDVSDFDSTQNDNSDSKNDSESNTDEPDTSSDNNESNSESSDTLSEQNHTDNSTDDEQDSSLDSNEAQQEGEQQQSGDPQIQEENSQQNQQDNVPTSNDEETNEQSQTDNPTDNKSDSNNNEQDSSLDSNKSQQDGEQQQSDDSQMQEEKGQQDQPQMEPTLKKENNESSNQSDGTSETGLEKQDQDSQKSNTSDNQSNSNSMDEQNKSSESSELSQGADQQQSQSIEQGNQSQLTNEDLNSNQASEYSNDQSQDYKDFLLDNQSLQSQIPESNKNADESSMPEPIGFQNDSEQQVEEEEYDDDTNDLSEQENNSDSSNLEDAAAKKEKLQAIRDQLKNLSSQLDNGEESQNKTVEEAIKDLERSHLTGEKKLPIESFEEDYGMSNANQELMNRLKELAPFQDRDRGPGYSIDVNGNADVPDSVIRTLIVRFLNQRFIKRETDLNVRSNSLEKTAGFYKWDVKAVVTHLQTHQITKVLSDKYGYEYDNGKNENVPFSFYFDLSGSMSSYTNLLATIAIELLKKNVKVLVGFNERVNYQIDSINKLITVEDLARVLTEAGQYQGNVASNSKVKMKRINRNIDNYLISSKSEKCVVFSDFDPLDEVVNLSQACNTYWFCFESRYERSDLEEYKGFIYPVQNITDIAKGLLKVNDYRFETLCYLEKSAGKGKKKTLGD